MAQFIGFRKVKVTNPSTGVEKEKLQVIHKDGHSYSLLTDMSVEEIKKDRDTLLGRVILCEGEFGTYAMFTRAIILESF